MPLFRMIYLVSFCKHSTPQPSSLLPATVIIAFPDTITAFHTLYSLLKSKSKRNIHLHSFIF